MTREQFISYVESTQGALRRFLVALCCGDSTLADDIAQETLIKAYLSCESFKDTEKFTAWIFRIGYNSFIDLKRSIRVLEDVEQACHVTSNDRADSYFQYQGLYAALGKLSPKERSAILLFYMQGYSVKEISDMMESSQDAVKQYLSRGRVHLRGLLLNS